MLLQSMAATKTTDIDATVETCNRLAQAGAGLVRVAVDTQKDAEALREIRAKTTAQLSVDLQENYRLAEIVAPFVEKIRYNPGHLHHAEPGIPWRKKVERLVEIAVMHDCALRIGVNGGSLERECDGHVSGGVNGAVETAVNSALSHAAFIDSLGFSRFCVSVKASDPEMVVAANRRFAAQRPDVPLHLGVTEAGMPPAGILKSRAALEPLLAEGIGDTLRVSLTVSNERKQEEIEAGRLILQNVAAGNILTDWKSGGLNIVSCPSCARVENDRFVALAEQVREATRPFSERNLTIAVMGCRVNGPGETDHADIGLWCGPKSVNLKCGTEVLGSFDYDAIIPRMLEEVEKFLSRAAK